MTCQMIAIYSALGLRSGLSSDSHVDMTAGSRATNILNIEAQPQSITFDAARAALIVVDMQKDFCAKGGWVDQCGYDVDLNRAPIKPLQKLLPALRAASIPIVWLDWGNRPDLKNLPPNQLHIFNRTGRSIGLGDPLPNGAHVLEKESSSAAVIEELEQYPEDICVDKYRMSGFLGYGIG